MSVTMRVLSSFSCYASNANKVFHASMVQTFVHASIVCVLFMRVCVCMVHASIKLFFMRVCISLFLCEYDFSIHASMFFHGSCEYGISSAMRVLVTYKAMRVLTDIYSMRVLNWVRYASMPYLVHASMVI